MVVAKGNGLCTDKGETNALIDHVIRFGVYTVIVRQGKVSGWGGSVCMRSLGIAEDVYSLL